MVRETKETVCMCVYAWKASKGEWRGREGGREGEVDEQKEMKMKKSIDKRKQQKATNVKTGKLCLLCQVFCCAFPRELEGNEGGCGSERCFVRAQRV